MHHCKRSFTASDRNSTRKSSRRSAVVYSANQCL
nr:MAG TPA: hypothetical protein [Caudoviricetes sp.]